MSKTIRLARDTNQALKLAEYAAMFMKKGNPSQDVIERTKLFHTDSVLLGLSALALKTNSPTVLKNEALTLEKRSVNKTKKQKWYSRCFGSSSLVPVEKAVLANCAAVREWDSNGTVFGYREGFPEHQAGEFGHNDFYPVIVAAANHNGYIDGKTAIKAMVLSDEIRGRFAESFSLKTYKIDHVVHGAIASAVVYGQLVGANAEQIESALGLMLAHYIPFRAIRAGHQLSDSKGASAGISTEMAILCVKRAMAGFQGPKDIFRNPDALFRLFAGVDEDCPFDVLLGFKGDDFSIQSQHLKMGIYEHQSGSAIQGILDLLVENPSLAAQTPETLDEISITAYLHAYNIIGGPEKWNCTTRQSADHSMAYLVSTVLRKAMEYGPELLQGVNHTDDLWLKLMLEPKDYSPEALFNPTTKAIMNKIKFYYGGEEYDSKYPEGIPTSVRISYGDESVGTGLIMFPAGHAKNETADLFRILNHKFNLFGSLALEEQHLVPLIENLQSIETLDNTGIRTLYDVPIRYADKSIDAE